MSVPTFYVGELPTTPLVIELTGVPIDLSTYAEVELVGDELPAGTVTVLSAEENLIEYTQTAPWEDPGVFEVQAKLTRIDNRVDYSDFFEIAVKGAKSESFVTTTQAWDLTGQAVSSRDLAEAESFLSLVLGRNLSDAVWRSGINPVDLGLIKQGIAWQAAYEQPEPPVAPLNARRIRSGDVEISFDKGGPILGTLLAPMAILALKGLSWRNSHTIHATPFLGSWPREADPPYDSTWPVAGRGFSPTPPGGRW